MNDASGNEDRRLIQMRNAARQLSMLNDADKLLRLANKLHLEVAANKSATFTASQLRKVQEIEKLAHRVRAEMAISLADAGSFAPGNSLGP